MSNLFQSSLQAVVTVASVINNLFIQTPLASDNEDELSNTDTNISTKESFVEKPEEAEKDQYQENDISNNTSVIQKATKTQGTEINTNLSKDTNEFSTSLLESIDSQKENRNVTTTESVPSRKRKIEKILSLDHANESEKNESPCNSKSSRKIKNKEKDQVWVNRRDELLAKLLSYEEKLKKGKLLIFYDDYEAYVQMVVHNPLSKLSKERYHIQIIWLGRGSIEIKQIDPDKITIAQEMKRIKNN